MSTPAAPVASSTIHPSWFSRAGTFLAKIGTAIKNGIAKMAGDTPEITAAIKKVAPTAEALSNMILPGSGTFEQHLLDVWGVAASAVNDAGDAAAANGVNITLDQALVNDIKSFLPQVKAYLSPAAGPAPAPPNPAGSPAVKAS